MNFHSFMAPVSFQVVADTASFHLANTSFLSHFALWQLGMWFHSAMADASFLLTPISFTTSFLNGKCCILCFIPPRQLFHAIFHSFWHSFQLNFHFFMAATWFSLGFCLIPPWQLFHAIFHSFWHLFQSNFHSSWYSLHSALLSGPTQWVIRRVVTWPGT